MNKKRIILALIGLVVLAAGSLAGIYLSRRSQELRKAAAPATTLSLSSTPPEISVGQNVAISVNIDTGENQVVGAELYLSFDPQLVEVTSVTSGAFFAGADEVSNRFDNTEGSVTHVLLIPQNDDPKSGSGVISTIVFNAKSSGEALVEFAPSTIVAAIAEGQNVLTSSSPVTISISPGEGGDNTGNDDSTGDQPDTTGDSSDDQSSDNSGGGAQVTIDLANGDILYDSYPIFTGTAGPGSTINITVESGLILDSVLADDTGNWSWTPLEPIEDGDHTITVVATDVYENTSTVIVDFVMSSASESNDTGGGYGGGLDNPTPTPTATPQSTPPAQPVSGNEIPTLTILTIGIILLAGGALLLSVI